MIDKRSEISYNEGKSVEKREESPMRMRKKKNCAARTERASAYLFDPAGKEVVTCEDLFGRQGPFYLEIGCGKGRFLCEQGRRHPERFFAGIERIPDVLVLALEKAAAAEQQNVRFLSLDAEALCEVFAPAAVDGIYLNFSDPWPKARHAKRRLNGPAFLERYRRLLKPGGAIEIKTDNVDLFDFGLESLEAGGWEILDLSRDLTAEQREENVVTEYEQRWSEMGIKIHFVKASPAKK